MNPEYREDDTEILIDEIERMTGISIKWIDTSSDDTLYETTEQLYALYTELNRLFCMGYLTPLTSMKLLLKYGMSTEERIHRGKVA